MAAAANVIKLDAIAEENKLKKLNKDKLVGYITTLRKRVEELEAYKDIEKRVVELEKSHIRCQQYNRRESIEIYGIPEDVVNLEITTLAILNEIGVNNIHPWQVHACHRMKNKNVTIIRFITRKFADLAIHNRKELKNFDNRKFNFNDDVRIFINESLCPPLKYLHYKVRLALKAKKIAAFKLWKGKLTIKLTPESKPTPIQHINDLKDLELVEKDEIVKL